MKLLRVVVEKEMLFSENHTNQTPVVNFTMHVHDLSSLGSSSTPSYSSEPSSPNSYSLGSITPQNHQSGTSISGGCSNFKHLLGKIKVLEAAVEMHMHPEQPTRNSTALLHELYNDMDKLGLEYKDEGDDEEDQGLNVGEEEGHVEEEEEDELYKDVNINKGRGMQETLEVEDSHVTLTPVNPDGQQQSSSVSLQFVTSMLNPTLDVGMESIFETTSQLDVQTPTSVAPVPITTSTMTSSTIATTKTTSQAPILPTTVPSDIIQNLPNFGSLFCFDDRQRSLEENFSESDRLRDEAQRENDECLRTVDENIKKIIKETSYAVAADLSEMELKKILIEKMEGNKSIQRSDEQRNLYKALVEAYKSDKIILDTYGETVTLKRRRNDDADKDEEPSAGPDQGSKRRKEGKEPESASAPTETATRSAGRSTQGSRSRQVSASEYALAEEPVQTTSQMEEPSHPEFDTGADDLLIVQSSQQPEWFPQQQKPPTPNRDWNKTLPAIHESIQPRISELAKQADSRSSFNELMDTPLDFSNFLMNRLKVDTLTPELLAGPTYELMKGSCKSLIELEYHLGEVYKATTDQLDWVNPKGKLTNLTVKESFAFNVSLRMFTRSIVIQRYVEDLQLGVESYQKRLNLTKPDTYRSDLKRKEAYTAYSNPQGFIYQNKDKKNRLMRIDELHKFSDGTLTNVRTALDDRLKGIQMQYLPQTIWRKSDKDRAPAMIQAIDKRLKTRRIMRSVERFVGGRLYEGDFRMLQRTI
nr:hypothetical protein [Tanacetum cinerariifolium]